MSKILKKIMMFTLVLSFIVPTVSYADEKNSKPIAEIYSKNSILTDQKTGRIITEKNADVQVPLASISKVMTFYVAQDALKNGEVNRDDIVTINKDMLKVSGSTMHLKVGEKVKFNELLKGLMIVSANDGALAIASHVCDGDINAFVDRMNEKAKSIGMKNTYFINPNGLPIYDWSKKDGDPKQNHSTARDISIMAKSLLNDYEKETTDITNSKLDKDNSRNFNYYNTNPLLHMHSNVDGLKTGYTDLAGYCLVFTDKMNTDGKSDLDNRMIGVVMGNWCKEDRVRSSDALYRLGENFETKLMCKKGETVAKGCVENIDKLKNIDLQPKEDSYAVVKNGENIKENIKYKKINRIPNEETVVANLEYIDEYGDIIKSVPLVSSDLEHVSIISKAKILANKIKRKFNIDKSDDKKELKYTIVV